MAIRGRRGRRPRLAPTDDVRRTQAFACRHGPIPGTAAWNSCAGGLPWGQPLDQRSDDAWSLTTDWPVAEETEILGHVVVTATVTSDQPVAYLSVKLNDVWPDGTSALVDSGPAQPDPSRRSAGAPGARRAVRDRVEMEATSWVFPAGPLHPAQRAGTDWPNTWVPPKPVTLDRRVVADATTGVAPGGAGVPIFSRSIRPFATVTTTSCGARATMCFERVTHVVHQLRRAGTRARHGGKMTTRTTGLRDVSIIDPARKPPPAERCVSQSIGPRLRRRRIAFAVTSTVDEYVRRHRARRLRIRHADRRATLVRAHPPPPR